MPSVRTGIPQPTWKQGFAPRDGPPAHPEFWRGIDRGWSLGLGPTGISNIPDVSGNGNDGTMTQVVGSDWSPNDGRYTINVDGTVGDELLLDLPGPTSADRYTLSMWFRSTNSAAFLSIFDNDNRHYSMFINSSGQVSFSVGITSGLTTTTDGMTTGSWHNLVLSQDGTTLTSYVDGKFKQSVSHAITLLPKQVSFGTNPSGGGTPMIGQYDDIFYWTRDLGASEVRKLYNLGRGGIFELRPRVYAKTPAAAADPVAVNNLFINQAVQRASTI